MRAEEFIKAQMVLLAYREAAHYGGTNNMCAVMAVVRNRALAGWQGGDWLKVMENWELTNGNLESLASLSRRHEMPDLRQTEMRDMLVAADEYWHGHAQDLLTEGALYYAELNQPITAWFQANILGKPEEHKRVAVVGPVYFFQ